MGLVVYMRVECLTATSQTVEREDGSVLLKNSHTSCKMIYRANIIPMKNPRGFLYKNWQDNSKNYKVMQLVQNNQNNFEKEGNWITYSEFGYITKLYKQEGIVLVWGQT